jgi:hypothetical protein
VRACGPNTQFVRTRFALTLLLACLLPASALAATHTYSATDHTHGIRYVLSGTQLTITLSKKTPAALRKTLTGISVSAKCTTKSKASGGRASGPSSVTSALGWMRWKPSIVVTLRGWKGAPATCELDVGVSKRLSLATFR